MANGFESDIVGEPFADWKAVGCRAGSSESCATMSVLRTECGQMESVGLKAEFLRCSFRMLTYSLLMISESKSFFVASASSFP
jgi:hypothetical protein